MPAALVGTVDNQYQTLQQNLPNGLPKVTLRVTVPGKTIVAEVNAKSLRRTVAAIAAAGLDGIVVVLQGRLEPGDALAEAGISAQPKAPKPTPAN